LLVSKAQRRDSGDDDHDEKMDEPAGKPDADALAQSLAERAQSLSTSSAPASPQQFRSALKLSSLAIEELRASSQQIEQNIQELNSTPKPAFLRRLHVPSPPAESAEPGEGVELLAQVRKLLVRADDCLPQVPKMDASRLREIVGHLQDAVNLLESGSAAGRRA
jgi:hypothetical protein